MQRYDVVGGVVTRIAPQGNPTGLTVTNTDAAKAVYLSDTPTLTGYPLGPGSSLSWDPARPLYVSCDTGNTVSVYVLENAGNLFNADAVGQAIINAGLAGDIAQQISISGAPPVNISHPVIDITAAIPGGAAWADGVFYTVARFNSLTFAVRDYGTFGQVRSITVSFFDDLDREITRLSFATRDNKNSAVRCPVATFTTPCLGTAVKIAISSAPIGSTVDIIAVGSYATVPRPRYFMDYPDPDPLPGGCSQVGLAIDGVIGISYPAPTAGFFRWALPMCATPMQLIAGTLGAGTGVNFSIVDAASSADLMTSVLLPPNSSGSYNLNLPARPCNLHVNVFAGLSNLVITTTSVNL